MLFAQKNKGFILERLVMDTKMAAAMSCEDSLLIHKTIIIRTDLYIYDIDT